MPDHADQYRVLIDELDAAVRTPHTAPPRPTAKVGPCLDWPAVVFVLIVIVFVVLYLQHG